MKKYLWLLLLYSTFLFGQTEKVILDNGLYPNAVMNQDGEIIVSAIFWDVPYSATAQKIDLRGNRLWSDSSIGSFITQPSYPPEYAFFDAPIILPSPDGGAFLIYDYAYWVEGTYEPQRFKAWPAIQKVNSNGDVLWGRTGIQLFDREITPAGGSTILNAAYTPDGDILVLWSWFVDSDPQEFATFGQKIDPETGELMWGGTGEKYLNSYSQKVLTSKNQIYVFHGDSALCLDRYGMVVWDLELIKNIGDYYNRNYSTNNLGDVLIIYSIRDTVKSLGFDKYGEYLYENKILFEGGKIFGNNPIIPLGNDRWLFVSDGIRCLDINGELIWDDKAVKGSGKIQSIATIDTNSFYFLTGTQKLFLYQCGREGNLLWNNVGIEIATDVIDEHNTILVDQYENAFIIFQAFALYEPEMRPRGTFIQKVSQSGEVGFVSSVQKTPDQIKSSSLALQTISYPNPFKFDSNIIITGLLPSIHQNVKIIIYNIMGREVMRYAIVPDINNQIIFSWNGRNRIGREVTPGIYVYSIMSGGHCLASGKIVKGEY